MDITLFISSFLAGMLTVLAPCVLPLLPIIIGSSITGKDRFKPLRITLALAFSLIIFTLLLKVSTIFINVPPTFLSGFSGLIIIVFGLISIFPDVWDRISLALNLSTNSDKLLENASNRGGIGGDILIGMSLGPVFASCSPTYAVILATVLPVNFWVGLVYMIMYALGLSTVLLLVSLLGRRFVNRIKGLANPNGIFKKVLGVIFVIVGLMIITGYDKQFQVFVAQKIGFDITSIDRKLIPAQTIPTNSNSQVSNIADPDKLLNVNYTAPEFVGLQSWVNSNPLTLNQLKGKVVLVDFWTYSCINCLRTLPYLTKLDETYKNKGLVIIGVHAPEFAFEKLLPNVQKAVTDNQIQYPVVQDNDFQTWKAYNNQFWPAKYLIDKDGNVRYTHFGEGGYDETEKVVNMLLGTKSNKMITETVIIDKGSSESTLSPETYLGYGRSKGFVGKINYDKATNYTLANNLTSNQWSLDGSWTINDENITTTTGGKLNYRINAKKVYLVAGGNTKAKVLLNGKVIKELTITDNKLYTIVDSLDFVKDGELEIQLEGNVSLNAFTFG